MAFVNLAQALFPIGSIYLSSLSVSPASILGGTWSRISSANLYACDSTIGAGSYGGSKTITENNLPSHVHETKVFVSGSGSETMPPWRMYIGDRWANTGAVRANGSSAVSNCSTGLTSFGNTSAVGGNANYIPYSYGVYVWVRTA